MWPRRGPGVKQGSLCAISTDFNPKPPYRTPADHRHAHGCMGALLVNLRLTGKQGYITSYPQFWDTAQKNKFTKRFEQLAGPDFPLDEQGRRWVTEEMVKLWEAHMEARDWNKGDGRIGRYESIAVKKVPSFR